MSMLLPPPPSAEEAASSSSSSDSEGGGRGQEGNAQRQHGQAIGGGLEWWAEGLGAASPAAGEEQEGKQKVKKTKKKKRKKSARPDLEKSNTAERGDESSSSSNGSGDEPCKTEAEELAELAQKEADFIKQAEEKFKIGDKQDFFSRQGDGKDAGMRRNILRRSNEGVVRQQVKPGDLKLIYLLCTNEGISGYEHIGFLDPKRGGPDLKDLDISRLANRQLPLMVAFKCHGTQRHDDTKPVKLKGPDGKALLGGEDDGEEDDDDNLYRAYGGASASSRNGSGGSGSSGSSYKKAKSLSGRFKAYKAKRQQKKSLQKERQEVAKRSKGQAAMDGEEKKLQRQRDMILDAHETLYDLNDGAWIIGDTNESPFALLAPTDRKVKWTIRRISGSERIVSEAVAAALLRGDHSAAAAAQQAHRLMSGEPDPDGGDGARKPDFGGAGYTPKKEKKAGLFSKFKSATTGLPGKSLKKLENRGGVGPTSKLHSLEECGCLFYSHHGDAPESVGPPKIEATIAVPTAFSHANEQEMSPQDLLKSAYATSSSSSSSSSPPPPTDDLFTLANKYPYTKGKKGLLSSKSYNLVYQYAKGGMPSVYNFLLLDQAPSHPEQGDGESALELLHSARDERVFALFYKYPFSPFQAFCVGVSMIE